MNLLETVIIAIMLLINYASERTIFIIDSATSSFRNYLLNWRNPCQSRWDKGDRHPISYEAPASGNNL